MWEVKCVPSDERDGSGFFENEACGLQVEEDSVYTHVHVHVTVTSGKFGTLPCGPMSLRLDITYM